MTGLNLLKSFFAFLVYRTIFISFFGFCVTVFGFFVLGYFLKTFHAVVGEWMFCVNRGLAWFESSNFLTPL